MVRRSVKFHLLLALVAVALLSALHHEPAEVTISSCPDLASHVGRSATELGQTALRQRSGYTMGGWALGDVLPSTIRLEASWGVVSLAGVEIGFSDEGKIVQLRGAPLDLDGQAVLPSAPTPEQCLDVFGEPYRCGLECCLHDDYLEWQVGAEGDMLHCDTEGGPFTLTRSRCYHHIQLGTWR